MIKPYVFLLIAILSEVAASTALRATKGFTQLVPSIITIVGYAIWSGVGMVLITILGWLIYGQKMDWAGLLGIALIIAGVVIIQLFSEQTV